MFFVPDDLARTTVARLGSAGVDWLNQLPDVVAELERRWSLEVGPAFGPGGVMGFVAPATCADGTAAVLKISIPDRETIHEAEALRLYDGVGAARLLAADVEQGALLLERLEPGTPLLAVADEDEANSIAAGVLRQLWRPAPPEHPFDLATDRAAEWAETVMPEFAALDKPFDLTLAQEAARLFAELGSSMGDPVLLHQDFHHGNILAARRQPWLAIDPKPLVGERSSTLARCCAIGSRSSWPRRAPGG